MPATSTSRVIIADFLYRPDPSGKRDAIDTDVAIIVDAAGVICEIGGRNDYDQKADSIEHYQLIMPGVINAHIHTTDAGRTERVRGGEGLVAWVTGLLGARGASGEEPGDTVSELMREIRQRGTVAIGEVANDERTLQPIIESGMYCRFIYELIGFVGSRAEQAIERGRSVLDRWSDDSRVSPALGAHAPYSVSLELMELIATESRRRGRKWYQHLAEDPDERILFEQGQGDWRRFLEKLGVWDDTFNPPGRNPIETYDRLGLLGPDFVAVHLTDATDDELRLLASRGVQVILSPTSNLHITGRLPNVPLIVELGMAVALGTDGKGSNPSMDVFDEARVLAEYFPDLPAGSLLRALTLGGASILEFGHLGTIEPGQSPGLVSIEITQSLKPDLRTVEEAILQASRRTRIL